MLYIFRSSKSDKPECVQHKSFILLRKLRGLSSRANYTDRRLSAKLMTTFSERGCRVVSLLDPYGSILIF
jgi:hypothetical protein